MADLDFIRIEIERTRGQVHRQRKEILQLQRAGISTAELLLGRMHSKIDALCVERERLKAEQPSKPKVLGPELVMHEPPKWCDANAKDTPPGSRRSLRSGICLPGRLALPHHRCD
jgi:hypothetical protein